MIAVSHCDTLCHAREAPPFEYFGARAASVIDLRALSESRLLALIPARVDTTAPLPMPSAREPTLGALVVREMDNFLEGRSDYFESLRAQWTELVAEGERVVVRVLSERIASRLGVRTPVVEGMVALVLLHRWREQQPPRVREPAPVYRLAS